MSQINALTERTPLLGPDPPRIVNGDIEQGPIEPYTPPTQNSGLPSIRSLELLLDGRAPDALLGTAIRVAVRSYLLESNRTRTALILLACLRTLVASNGELGLTDTRDVAQASLMDVKAVAQEEWDALVERAPQEEMADVMWMRVPLDDTDDSPCIRGASRQDDISS